MTIRELNRDQLTELKQRMIDDEINETEGRNASYGELAHAEIIPDEKVFEKYEGIEFSNDDFYTAGSKNYKYVMHVTETVESTYVVMSKRKLNHEELEERTKEARTEGRLQFKAVSELLRMKTCGGQV